MPIYAWVWLIRREAEVGNQQIKAVAGPRNQNYLRESSQARNDLELFKIFRAFARRPPDCGGRIWALIYLSSPLVARIS